MTSPNTTLITQFYESFARGDAEGMTACYGDTIQFEDPAFGHLVGDDAKNMWRMLLTKNKGNIEVTVRDIWADEQKGRAHWTAKYIFQETGRSVINEVDAEFQFANGRIVVHHDHFDFWKWTQQVFGTFGYLFGWSHFMQAKIQQGTRALLKDYTAHQH